MGSFPIVFSFLNFGWIHVAYLLSFLCSFFIFFVFVLVLLTNADYATGLFILDCLFAKIINVVQF